MGLRPATKRQRRERRRGCMCRPSGAPTVDPPVLGTEAPACLPAVVAGEPRRPRACGVEPPAAGELLPAFTRFGVACTACWSTAAADRLRVLTIPAAAAAQQPVQLRVALRWRSDVIAMPESEQGRRGSGAGSNAAAATGRMCAMTVAHVAELGGLQPAAAHVLRIFPRPYHWSQRQQMTKRSCQHLYAEGMQVLGHVR